MFDQKIGDKKSLIYRNETHIFEKSKKYAFKWHQDNAYWSNIKKLMNVYFFKNRMF